MSEEIKEEGKTIPYIQIGVKIGINRVGFIQLPKDVTHYEIKNFIKQCKQIKRKPDVNSIR